MWDRTLGALRGSKWIVFGKGSVAGPESVLEYMGRYTHRVAISNGRILRMDDRSVTFRYKDYREDGTLKEMTLEGVEFVRRLSLHILPPGLTKIRHYGILGNNRRATLVPLARQALEHSPWRLDSPPLTRTPVPKAEASGCPRCGSDDIVCLGRLGRQWTLHRSPSRGPAAASGCRRANGNPGQFLKKHDRTTGLSRPRRLRRGSRDCCGEGWPYLHRVGPTLFA